MAKQINSTAKVIEVLGGPTAVARILKGAVSPNAVGNWRERGFPAETFIALTTALNAKGFSAPPSLWKRMHEVAPEAVR